MTSKEAERFLKRNKAKKAKSVNSALLEQFIGRGASSVGLEAPVNASTLSSAAI